MFLSDARAFEDAIGEGYFVIGTKTTEASREHYFEYCRRIRRPMVIITPTDRRFSDVQMLMDTTGMRAIPRGKLDDAIEQRYHNAILGIFQRHVPEKLPFDDYRFDDKGLSPWTIGDWPASNWIRRNAAKRVARQLLDLGAAWANAYGLNARN